MSSTNNSNSAGCITPESHKHHKNTNLNMSSTNNHTTPDCTITVVNHETFEDRTDDGTDHPDQHTCPCPCADSKALQHGENGALEITLEGITDPIVALHFASLRGTSEIRIMELFDATIEKARQAPNLFIAVMQCLSVFLLCFLTRDCRGGKGERDQFFMLFEQLCGVFTLASCLVIQLISHYGCWKDYFTLIARGKLCRTVVVAILDHAAKQFVADHTADHPTLLAKWLPREGSALYGEVSAALKDKYGMNALASEMMSRVPAEIKSTFEGPTVKKFRKMLVAIADKLELIEKHLCANTRANINFSHVPSLATDRYKRALLLQSVNPFPKEKRLRNFEPRNTPDDPAVREDRQVGKEHFMSFVLEGKIKGSQLAIEKLVDECSDLINLFEENDTLDDLCCKSINAAIVHRQFEALVESVRAQLETVKAELLAEQAASTPATATPASGKLDLTDIKMMLDVSGSMRGVPMNVCIGLGMLLNRLQQLECTAKGLPQRHQTFLTFDTNPKLVSVQDCPTFPGMVKRCLCADWGGTTNFFGAFKQIMTEAGHNIANAPKKCVVFSDMQFNTAIRHEYIRYDQDEPIQCEVKSWATMYDDICVAWKEWFRVGDDQLPTIIFWNLRGNTTGSPVDSNTPGVIQISGYNASLLKMVLFGEAVELAKEADDAAPTKAKATPAETLAKTLSSKAYSLVSQALHMLDDNDAIDVSNPLVRAVINLRNLPVESTETTPAGTVPSQEGS